MAYAMLMGIGLVYPIVVILVRLLLSQQNIGDVTVGIGSSATTHAVTGTISSAIASLGKAWSHKNGPGHMTQDLPHLA